MRGLRVGTWGILFLVLMVGTVGWSAEVSGNVDHDRAQVLRNAGTIQPLDRILEVAFKAHSGHLLEVTLDDRGGVYHYQVEVVDKAGKVWEISVDAVTGEFLGADKKHGRTHRQP